MSEAELIESIQLAIGNAVSTYAVFWTLVGGYLVAAFMAGPRLTRSQAVTVTLLFGAASLFNSFGAFTLFVTIEQYSAELAAVNPARDVGSGAPLGLLSLAMNVVILVAALKFMWDVRRPVD